MTYIHYLVILARNSGRGDTYRFQAMREDESAEDALAAFTQGGWFARHGHHYWKVTVIPIDTKAAIGRHL